MLDTIDKELIFEVNSAFMDLVENNLTPKSIEEINQLLELICVLIEIENYSLAYFNSDDSGEPLYRLYSYHILNNIYLVIFEITRLGKESSYFRKCVKCLNLSPVDTQLKLESFCKWLINIPSYYFVGKIVKHARAYAK